MADSRSRVVSALNFLTGEGISYHPDGVEHTALEALIEDYLTTEMTKPPMTAAPMKVTMKVITIAQ